MPTVFRQDGFRFFFWSNEGVEPPHIHVERGSGHAKFWVSPTRLAGNDGLKPAELRHARTIIDKETPRILKAWHEHFGEQP